ARPRPRPYDRRDGTLRRAPPAGLGSARAGLADPQHGPRRLLVRPRKHPGPRQPLVKALVRSPALGLRRTHRGTLAVPLDDAACPPLATARPPPPTPARARQRAPAPGARRALPMAAEPASCPSGSPPPAC